MLNRDKNTPIFEIKTNYLININDKLRDFIELSMDFYWVSHESLLHDFVQQILEMLNL